MVVGSTGAIGAGVVTGAGSTPSGKQHILLLLVHVRLKSQSPPLQDLLQDPPCDSQVAPVINSCWC